MSRVLLAFDVDGTLIDTRRSFTAIVKEVSGVADDDAIDLFRSTGGFNDDWELARAMSAWREAGKPKIVERCDTLKDVLLWCSNDPGDLAERCIARYRGTDGRGGLWQQEQAIIDGAHLDLLSGIAGLEVVACTGRDQWELSKAEQRLGYCFAKATTAEAAKKPDPRALLRLLDDDVDYGAVVLVGDTHADRLTIKRCRAAKPSLTWVFVHVDLEHTALPLVQALIDAGDDGDAGAIVARFAEQVH
jgi:phosphoglycolate phosphatase-like HAD superfamily hydrolase